MTQSRSVGFIGIGNMGWPMAARIAGAGHSVTVADASASRVKDFAAAFKANIAASNSQLAQTSDIVITMLPTSAIVDSVFNGTEGVLAGLRRGAIVVDMSSSVPSCTQALAKTVAAKGGAFLDAPVSGGVPRAESGDLSIMVGGPKEALIQVEPVLHCMGSTITHVGGVGSAHAMKALNNLVSAGGLLISVEALIIGKKFGLDPALMVDVLNTSSGMNNSTQKKLKQFVLSRKYNMGFGLDLMVKDLTIALDLAKESSVPSPFAALCREMWASAATVLGPGQDHTAIARLSEKLAGIEL